MERARTATRSSTPRGNLRRRPGDGGGGAEEPDGRGGRHHHLNPRASWCSYHQVTFKTPPLRRLAGGRGGAGLERRSTPRGDLRRRPGDGDGGVGGPVRSRGASPSLLKPRASWCSYHREALTLASTPASALPAQEWRPKFRRLAAGTPGPGQQRRSTPRPNSWRRPGDGDGGIREAGR